MESFKHLPQLLFPIAFVPANGMPVPQPRPQPYVGRIAAPASVALTSAAVAATSEEQNDPGTHARKKGRKRQYVTDEQRHQAQTKRTERNKYFARENRQRKKQYILTLESRVEALTAELDQCRRKLAELEARECARRDSLANLGELYQQFKVNTQRFEEQRIVQQMTNAIHIAAHNIGTVMPVVKSVIEGKNKMLDLMAETLMEFAVPVPYQFLAHLVDVKRTGKPWCEGGPLTKQMRDDCASIFTQSPEDCNLIEQFAIRVKENACKYYSALENMKGMVADLDLYMMQSFLPKLGPSSISNLLKWIPTMMDRRALEQLRFLGAGIVSLTVVKWDPQAAAGRNATPTKEGK